MKAEDWQIRVRFGTAMILTAYVVSHFINHAAGLYSYELMEKARHYFLAVWRSPFLFWLVPAALMIHLLFAFWNLFKRRTLRVPNWQKAQILCGLAIPFFLISHIFHSRVAHASHGLNDTYFYILSLMMSDPIFLLTQLAFSAVVWVHAILGLHFSMRMRRWYGRHKILFLSLFILIPLSGILGVLKAGTEVRGMNAEQRARKVAEMKLPSPAAFRRVGQWSNYTTAGVYALLILFLAARFARGGMHRKRKNILIRYDDGTEVFTESGPTILEVSRANRLPHAQVCGGRGRCSTCRVRVHEGLGNLAAPGERERKVLAAVGAAEDTRLACQTEVTAPLSVSRLLPPNAGTEASAGFGGGTPGQDRAMAILFADLKGFTAFSEKRLPFDVVFMLNRYFHYMGAAVEKAGGIIDKFIGDGVMAIFGHNVEPGDAGRQALRAAVFMHRALERINEEFARELEEPLSMRIGIHMGDVILGRMGYRDTMHLTVIGDVVNTASRLEALNKKTDSAIIFTSSVAMNAGFESSDLKLYRARVRGRDERIPIHIIRDIRTLEELLERLPSV